MTTKIKAKYDTEDEIPEAYKDLFELRNEKWVLINIEGIATDANIHRLEGTVKKLREERDEFKKKLDGLGGKSPDDIHALEDKIAELEAQLASSGKPDDEKVNQLVEARIKARIGPIERELKQAKDELHLTKEQAAALSGTITKSKISDAIRKAALNKKTHPDAIEDALILAERVFEVTEIDGRERVVTKDQVGVTPGLDPESWLTEIAPSRPHWWPQSVGAGASGGGKGGGINGDNPWGAKNWNLTKQGEVIKSQGREKADQLARAAGSHVGASAPPALTAK